MQSRAVERGPGGVVPTQIVAEEADPSHTNGIPPLCVEMGFTWTFPRNQDATVKLKSELISIQF